MAGKKGYRKDLAAKKPPLTHFICLPLVTPASKPQLEESLRSFRDDVNSTVEATKAAVVDGMVTPRPVRATIHPKAIRPVGALHCTLGVMSLENKRLDEASQLLQSLDIPSLLSPVTASSINSTSTAEPLKIDLRGLLSMHPVQSTSILYSAPSDPTGRLYPFCLEVQKLFKEKDFLVLDDRELKLHATIVNTIYAKTKTRRQPTKQTTGAGPVNSEDGVGTSNDKVEGHGPNANAPLRIDARELVEQYRNFVWAENVVLNRIAICEMGAKKQFDAEGRVVGEEYKEVASIDLPS